MSLSFISALYEHINQAGKSQLLGLGKSTRYRSFRKPDLQTLGLFQKISSAVVYPSADADGTVILFGPLLGVLNMGDFNGSFVQITNKKGSGVNQVVNQLAPYAFNDATQSLLMVAPNRGFEVRLSFRDLFLDKWKTILDAKLAGSQAKRHGDPTLTWEMWPQGISYLDPNAKYLKIHQKLDIVLDWWPDYEASVTYHVYLYLDGAGKLKGYVQRWAYWVEGGVKSGEIANKLEPKVISGMDALNTELSTQLGAFSSFTLKDLYYLPGNQTTPPPSGVITGTTLDDVTIVVAL